MNTSDQADRGRRIVCVVGTDRSGTSSITRMLSAVGVDLGEDLLPEASYNPRGLWEDRTTVEINEELIRHATSYESLSTASRDHDSEVERFLQRIVAHVRSMTESHPLCGMKDPRLCLTVPLWQVAFAQENVGDSYVVTVRHPLSVAESLFARATIPLGLGVLLWTIYTASALQFTRGRLRSLVSYDGLVDEPVATMHAVAEQLDLGHGSDGAARALADGFIDGRLRNWQHSWSELPPFSCTRLPALSLLMEAIRPPAPAFVRDIPVELLAEAREQALESLRRHWFRYSLPGLRNPLAIRPPAVRDR